MDLFIYQSSDSQNIVFDNLSEKKKWLEVEKPEFFFFTNECIDIKISKNMYIKLFVLPLNW